MTRLKLDENLSRHLKPRLSAIGHDTTTTAEENLLSKPDSKVARAAFSEGRMLLTLDVGFGDLGKYPPGSHPGILLFRPQSLGPLEVNEYVASRMRNLDLDSLTGCTVIVEPARLRIRRPEEHANGGGEDE